MNSLCQKLTLIVVEALPEYMFPMLAANKVIAIKLVLRSSKESIDGCIDNMATKLQ